MTEIAVLRANAVRLTALAAAIERVRDRDRFYAETGRSDFRRRETVAGPMLVLYFVAVGIGFIAQRRSRAASAPAAT